MATRRNCTPSAKKLAQKSAKKLVASFPEPSNKPAAEAVAKFVLKPSVNAAAVITAYSMPFGAQDLGALAAALSSDMTTMHGGDMKRAEAMLFGQAHTLQAIFTNLARRAASNLGEYPDAFERYMRMALKAQGQCRTTLETLAAIKNPPVVFARQANINNGGQQQVNNSAGALLPGQVVPHAGIRENAQSKLLEVCDVERLDDRAPGTAGVNDPDLAPVGTIHRAAES